MAIYGHEEILRTLGGMELPLVSLFLGPPSVGKWATAEYLRGRGRIGSSDLLRVRSLTMDTARSLVRFAGIAPSGTTARLAIVQIDRASSAALNTLLKVMESAQETTKFILISEQLPSDTVTSRCFVFQFHILTDSQIEAILLDKNFGPTEAKRFAALSGGQVSRALTAMEGNTTKVTVLAVLRAFHEHDTEGLERLADRWSEEHTALLVTWCQESITQRWRVFTDEEADLPGQGLPLKILMALKQEIRPRLIVRSSLMSVLRGA